MTHDWIQHADTEELELLRWALESWFEQAGGRSRRIDLAVELIEEILATLEAKGPDGAL